MLNTFDEVESWYTRTKPMVSKHHTLGSDVRPIGERRRKWERIIKIDDNRYALHDGNYASRLWSHNANSLPAHLMVEYEARMAPILWVRREDGDYVHVRNHNHTFGGYSRYEFLRKYLPKGLGHHYNQQGRHYVYDGVHSHPLPKMEVSCDARGIRDTGMELVFKQAGVGCFNRSNLLLIDSHLIDREVKATFKDDLRAFFQQTLTLYEMLDVTWRNLNEYTSQAREWLKENGHVQVHSGWRELGPSVELWREIVRNPEHDLRIAAVAWVAYMLELRGSNVSEQIAWSRFNRLMNKTLQFTKKVEA